jgi:hypothetical protein
MGAFHPSVEDVALFDHFSNACVISKKQEQVEKIRQGP